MNPLVPDFILEQDAEGQYAGALDAAVLHVSLPAVVELAEQMIARQSVDPDALRLLFDPLFEAVHQSGGFVSAFSPSGGFTALFPDRPGRNVTRHARSAALAMRRSLLEFAARRALGAVGAQQMPFRIGLAWGTVHWTIVRIAQDRAYFLLYGPAIEACQASERGADDSELHLDRSFRERLPAATARESVAELDEPDLTGPLSLTVTATPAGADVAAFLPPGAGDVAPEGEIREVTTVALSLDRIASPTERIQQLHDIAAMYGATFAGMNVTDRGFGALFYFGAPIAHESDHDRALDFALELKSNGLGVSRLAVGITRARCLVGFSGGEGRRDFACLGRSVHLAAQIARKAAPSSIWADERAFLAGEASHQWSTENIFRFEGFDLPILVYSLERRRIAVQEEFYDLGPIGRESELERLTRALEPLFAGRSAGVVYIVGEAGIGKSYLVHSYRHQRAQLMDMRPLLWMEARCDQTLKSPLYAFEFALKEYLGISSEIGHSAKQAGLDLALQLLLERLPRGWSEVRDGIERSRGALARLLKLRKDEPAAPNGEAERRADAVAALAALLVAESSLQPVVVHLDDAQWADPTSLEAVRAITAACRDLPLAVICSARPGASGEAEVHIPLEPGIPSQRIDVPPLPPERLLSLAEPFFGGPLPTMLESLIGQTAGGNPFFAQEILAYWLEDGRYGSAHDTARSSRFMPPRTMNSLLVARLERLESRTKQTVIAAAVLGREFDTRVLARMIPDASALVDHLRFGEAQRIWSRMGEHRFEFCTVLIRDAAYGMLPKLLAERQHRLAAEAIEAVYGEDLEDQRAAIESHRKLAS
ncbi:guanylate cyclase [Sorangium cellulosum]|uniref:Guanylate cyclase n=1 Tax=Sorangium cellulosum TaxID=56 RepID=A0A2L0F8A5_SORCE|nr:AAA family ATPase [Sorangium cellulosum]AUX47828.1 guanylate cyclase [Sorangium cellulosum]